MLCHYYALHKSPADKSLWGFCYFDQAIVGEVFPTVRAVAYFSTVRKRLTFIVAILSLALIGSPLQAASPKAGSKCVKLGATSTLAGKKYTCVKSGKKLVWNKGVSVKPVTKPTPSPISTPEATPSPTPIATPTPTATPTPSSTPMPTATPTPTPVDTRTPEDIKNLAILEKSWTQINDLKPAQDS